jgi:predicted alpha/beta-fold hydrolase
VVDRIQVPTLIVTAENDPFVPSAPFRDPVVTGNRQVTVNISRGGGHCAFLERPTLGYDGYWAEREIVRFVTAHAPSVRRSTESVEVFS